MTGSEESFDRLEIQKFFRTTSATAMIFTCGELESIRAGKLSAEGFKAFQTALDRYWPDSHRQAVNRYVVLLLDDGDFIVFAKHLLQGKCQLGLAFPLQTPLIRIRQDMTDFLRQLSNCAKVQKAEIDALEQSLQFTIKPSPEPHPLKLEQDQVSEWEPEVLNASSAAKEDDLEESEKKQQESRSHEIDPSESDEEEKIPFHLLEESLPDDFPLETDLLGADLPWQSVEAGGEDFALEVKSSQERVNSSTAKLNSERAGAEFEAVTEVDDGEWRSLDTLFENKEDQLSISPVNAQGIAATSNLNESDSEQDQPLREAESLPKGSILNLVPTDVELESELDLLEVSDITFYLVPKLVKHFLVGELAQSIRRWIPQICEIYGWQLDYLSVRPDYIKWTLKDFPESVIREMLKIMRRRTSHRIFRKFPILQQESQSNDYWAPGYLVDTQNREFSTQALISHISDTRGTG